VITGLTTVRTLSADRAAPKGRSDSLPIRHQIPCPYHVSSFWVIEAILDLKTKAFFFIHRSKSSHTSTNSRSLLAGSLQTNILWSPCTAVCACIEHYRIEAPLRVNARNLHSLTRVGRPRDLKMMGSPKVAIVVSRVRTGSPHALAPLSPLVFGGPPPRASLYLDDRGSQ
jgi:hypothetical protein